MTIGEALKKERVALGLTQKQMAGDVLSVAAYSKIENNIHAIDADNLFKILALHQINENNFYKKIRQNYEGKKVYENTETLSIKLQRAFYRNDLKAVKRLQQKILSLKNVSYELKLRTVLTVAVLSNDYSLIDEKTKKEIFSRIFDQERWSRNQNSLRLFGNSMFLWDFENISFAIEDVLREYKNINKFSRDVQERVGQVYVNYLYNSSKYGDSNTNEKVIERLDDMDGIPHLVLYKLLGRYYQAYFNQEEFMMNQIKDMLNVCGCKPLADKLPC